MTYRDFTAARNFVQDEAASSDLSTSTRVRACCMASLMAKNFGPLNGEAPTALARSAKILPVGALLKNALVWPSRASLVSASVWLGNVPLAVKALICCSGAVSQAASFLASAWFLPCVGTVR